MLHSRSLRFLLAAALLWVVSCGKDASIQLNIPEGEKTRQVSLSVTCEEGVKVESILRSKLETKKIEGSGQKAIAVTVKNDAHFELKLPAGYKVEKISSDSASDIHISPTNDRIDLPNVVLNTKVDITIGKIRLHEAPMKKVTFHLASAQAQPVTVRFSGAGRGEEKKKESALVFPDGSGFQSFYVEEGEATGFKVELPAGWEIEKWDASPGVDSNTGHTRPVLPISKVHDDAVILARVRPIPVKPIVMKQVKFSLLAPIVRMVGPVLVSAVGREVPYPLTGSGTRTFEIPEGEDLRLSLKLPPVWEVVKWHVSDGADSDFGHRNSELVVSNVRNGVAVRVEIRPVPILTFKIIVKSNEFAYNGSGYVKWEAFAPDDDTFKKPVFHDSCGLPSLFDDKVHPCETYRFPNGTKIHLEMVAYGADPGSDRSLTWYDKTVVVDDNKQIEFDFRKLEKIELKKRGDKQLYELIGTNPHLPPGSNPEVK